jgi:DNA-3-methyladenine glycosylase
MAMDITGELNGADLCVPDGPLTVEEGDRPARTIIAAPRVGVDYAGEWAGEPFRFFEDESACVSVRPR